MIAVSEEEHKDLEWLREQGGIPGLRSSISMYQTSLREKDEIIRLAIELKNKHKAELEALRAAQTPSGTRQDEQVVSECAVCGVEWQHGKGFIGPHSETCSNGRYGWWFTNDRRVLVRHQRRPIGNIERRRLEEGVLLFALKLGRDPKNEENQAWLELACLAYANFVDKKDTNATA